MQEGYKESKTGVGRHFSSPPAFSLLFSPFPRSVCVFFCLHIVFVPHITSVQIVFLRSQERSNTQIL